MTFVFYFDWLIIRDFYVNLRREFSGFQIRVMTMKSLSKEEWIKKCKQLLDHKKEMEERFKANADTDIYALYGKA